MGGAKQDSGIQDRHGDFGGTLRQFPGGLDIGRTGILRHALQIPLLLKIRVVGGHERLRVPCSNRVGIHDKRQGFQRVFDGRRLVDCHESGQAK